MVEKEKPLRGVCGDMMEEEDAKVGDDGRSEKDAEGMGWVAEA